MKTLLLLISLLFIACSSKENVEEENTTITENIRRINITAAKGEIIYWEAIKKYNSGINESEIRNHYEESARAVFSELDSLLNSITSLYTTKSISEKDYQEYLKGIRIDNMKSGLDSLKRLGIKFKFYEIPNSDNISSVVEMQKIIQIPNKYDSVIVQTSGYFRGRFEDVAIYLSPQDIESDNYKNAIWIIFDKDLGLYEDEKWEKLQGEKLVVRGTFNSRFKGHLNQYSGQLTNVYFVENQTE